MARVSKSSLPQCTLLQTTSLWGGGASWGDGQFFLVDAVCALLGSRSSCHVGLGDRLQGGDAVHTGKDSTILIFFSEVSLASLISNSA